MADKPFQERFKKFLKSDKKNLKNLPEIVLTSDIINNLSPTAQINVRFDTIKDLEKQYEQTRLEENAIEKIWKCIKDMVQKDKPAEQRHLALNFLGATISNSGIERLGVNRIIFMTAIHENYLTEDPVILFDFFRCIIENGKNIEYVEGVVVFLICEWIIPIVLEQYPNKEVVIDYLTTLLKFNAAHLEEYVIKELLATICHQTLQCMSHEELVASNSFLETIVAYVYIPDGCLYDFLYVLTVQASMPNMIDSVWKIVQNLLRTELGTPAVYYLCKIVGFMDDHFGRYHYIRGAIFFVARALWSDKRIPALAIISPIGILDVLEKACEYTHPLIPYEIAISTSMLLRNCSNTLCSVSWGQVLDIVKKLLYFTASHDVEEHSKMIYNVINTIMDHIEDKIASQTFRGDLAQYYDLVEEFSEIRPDISVMKMLEWKVEGMNTLEMDGVTTRLLRLFHKHFRKEARPSIRLKMISCLKYLFDNSFRKDKYDICNIVVLSQMDEIDKEEDILVRKEATSLVAHMIVNIRAPIIDRMLLILEKVVLAPYASSGNSEPLKSYAKPEEIIDVYEGIKGLILVFKKKIWCLPSSHAIQAYQILMTSLELHYRNTEVLENVSHIRKEIFDMIFEMRADKKYHLGLPNCEDALLQTLPTDSPELREMLPLYTAYIVVDHKHGVKPKSNFLTPDDTFSMGSTEEEEDDDFSDNDIAEDDSAEVEKKEDNVSLHNAEEQENDQPRIDGVASSVDRESPEIPQGENGETYQILRNVQVKSSDEPFVEDPIYDPEFDINDHSIKVEVAHLSLTQAARLVIIAMKKEQDWSLLKTILERIPQVLLNKALILSKDGNDIHYLANTIRQLLTETEKIIPSLYNKPTKFSCSDFQSFVYPVLSTLASYHENLDKRYQSNIIKCLQSGVFTKSTSICISALTTCALEMRFTMAKDVKDIILTLSKISDTTQNAQPTLEFLSTVLHLPHVYQNFSRHQSFTVIAIVTPYTNPFKFNPYIVALAYHVICMWFLKSRKIYRQHFVRYISKNLYRILLQEGSAKPRGVPPPNQEQQKITDEKKKFHRDLHEICVDFMARNCFEVNHPIVRRTKTAEMLLKNGLTKTWLLGSRIITITTSGCYGRPFKQGICEQCCKKCQYDEFQEATKQRRRHKSDFHRPVSQDFGPKHQVPQSKDDLHMRPLSKDSSQSTITDPEEDDNYLCACWCRGWAEIYIRQATGNDCSMFRLLNRITNIPKEDVVPVNLLSTFYSAEKISSDKELSNFALLPEEIRPRIVSDVPEKTPTSEDWSNSMSAPSSGEASLASSDLKLDTKTETGESQHLPIYHCHSNPEVNKGASGGPPTDAIVSKLCGSSTGAISKQHNLYHSQSMVEGVAKTEEIQKTSRESSNATMQSQSSLSSPSPTLGEESSRTRHYSALQMKTSASSVEVCEKEEIQPIKRDRGHTISDMNPASRKLISKKLLSRRPTLIDSTGVHASASSSSLGSEATGGNSSQKSKEEIIPDRPHGVTPNSVFLQMFYQSIFRDGCFKPIIVPPENATSLKILDLISPLEHHKIGVIYVDHMQKSEVEIFQNTSGSERYFKFIKGLGTVYELDELPPNTNLGGMDKRGVDGKLIYMWNDELMQVLFHVATAIPNKETDPRGNNKKRHIGNNYVTIVYNNSSQPYKYDTIKSQFNHAIVEIVPGDHNTNIVRLLVKPELSEFVSWDRSDTIRLVSDSSLSILARQMAVHANLAATVFQKLKQSNHMPYHTNWMERLRKIRALREKLVGPDKAARHFLEMQDRQYPEEDENETDEQFFSKMDFADWLEKSKPDARLERATTASFCHKNKSFLDY